MYNKEENLDSMSIENLLSIMQYYQEEFMYRHQHFWNILIKMLIFDVIIIILPITSETMGFTLSDGMNKYALIFPIFGLLIAILSRIILEDEAKKIAAVNTIKYKINKELPSLYQYHDYVENKSEKKVQLAHHLVNIIFSIELIMCILVFIITMQQSIG